MPPRLWLFPPCSPNVFVDEDATSCLAWLWLLILSSLLCSSYNWSKNKSKNKGGLMICSLHSLWAFQATPNFHCWCLLSPAGGRTSDSSPPKPTEDESRLYKFHLACIITLLAVLKTSFSVAVKISTEQNPSHTAMSSLSPRLGLQCLCSLFVGVWGVSALGQRAAEGTGLMRKANRNTLSEKCLGLIKMCEKPSKSSDDGHPNPMMS